MFTNKSALKYLAPFKALDGALAQMRNAAAQYMEDMFNLREPYALIFLGVPGVGKTFLAKLINSFFQQFMRQKVDRDISPEGEKWLCAGGFVNWGAALREMLDTGEWGRMGNYRGDFFVVLDDLMAESAKLRELSASKLFDILESRHARRWTIITANGDLDRIEAELDARISSRLIRDRNVCITLPPETPDYALRAK